MLNFRPMPAFIPTSRSRRGSPASRARLFLFSLGSLWLSGCGTAPGPDTIYDHTPRPATTKVLVVRGDLDRPYTLIAKLNTKADSNDGGDPMADLLQKAQRLGADALLLAPPNTVLKYDAHTGGGAGSGSRFSTVDEHDFLPQTDPQGEKYVLTGWAVAFRKQ
jgi:hypothetical protein